MIEGLKRLSVTTTETDSRPKKEAREGSYLSEIYRAAEWCICMVYPWDVNMPRKRGAKEQRGQRENNGASKATA